MNKKYFVFALIALFATSGLSAHAEEGRGNGQEGRGKPEFRPVPSQREEGDRFEERKENRGPKGPEVRGKAFLGSVKSVTGSTFTMTLLGKGANTATGTVYTVDATNAFIQRGPITMSTSTPSSLVTQTATATVSQITVGMRVLVNGSVNGTTITARNIHLDAPLRGFEKREERREDRKEERKEGKKIPAPIIDMSKIGDGQPVVVGTVGTTTGTTFTLTNKNSIVYSIDAASAKIFIKNATGTLSEIKVGDRVAVQGAVNGTTITATTVLDQGVVALKKIDEKTGLVKKNIIEKMGSFFRNLF